MAFSHFSAWAFVFQVVETWLPQRSTIALSPHCIRLRAVPATPCAELPREVDRRGDTYEAGGQHARPDTPKLSIGSTTPRYSSGCDEVEKCQDDRVIYRARRSRSSRGAFPSERTSRSSRSKFIGPRVLLRCSSFGWSASRSSWIRSGVLHSSMV